MREWGRRIVSKILFSLAKVTLWRFHPVVFAIAGSTNKASTKRAILERLPKTAAVRAHVRGYNTEIGLPLVVLDITGGGSSVLAWVAVVIAAFLKTVFVQSFPKLLVVELGVDAPGDMARLLQLVHPQALIVTTLLDETLRQEYALAVRSVPPDGCVILNHDDPAIRLLASDCVAPVRWYGMATDIDVRVEIITETIDGISAMITDKKQNTTVSVSSSRYGHHHLYAAAAAIALRGFFNTQPLWQSAT